MIDLCMLKLVGDRRTHVFVCLPPLSRFVCRVLILFVDFAHPGHAAFMVSFVALPSFPFNSIFKLVSGAKKGMTKKGVKVDLTSKTSSPCPRLSRYQQWQIWPPAA